jgi:hypothetical protein
MIAGMVSQSNPFTRKKRNPHKPSVLIQFFKLDLFNTAPVCHPGSNLTKTISLAANDKDVHHSALNCN